MDKWVEMAFEAWALYSRLKFKRVYDSSADIIIAFGSQFHGDRYPFDGPGNILAHAFYPYEENAYGGKKANSDDSWKIWTTFQILDKFSVDDFFKFQSKF